MNKIISVFLILSLVLMGAEDVYAQKKKKAKKKETQEAPAVPVKKTVWDIVGKEASKSEGLIGIYSNKQKLYFEIPIDRLNKEFLVVSRLAETPGISYGGTKVNTSVIRWELQYDKILLRSVSYQNVANDSLPIFQAVRSSNFEPIIRSFEIKHWAEDSNSVLIEVQDLFLGDVPPFTMSSRMRTSYKVKRIDKNRCFLDQAKAFPENFNIKVLLTFVASSPPQQSSAQSISAKYFHSFILLPEDPMLARSFDNRMGYFSVRQSEYGESQQVDENRFITRWRLEVPEDQREAYKNGQLVEPIKPITYYLDPATPLKWREAIRSGVEDWNAAFEEAGFRNAIRCLDAPTEDPDWDPEDVRYSVIRYYASPILNAYGPHVHDPRTGEILESDIGWYHNVMKLLRNWYFIQTAAVDEQAEKLPLSDSLMRELIRFVSAHEVGHTLGLQHNMKASHFYPTDSLRSPTFTSRYGTAPSIMDYARFNYVAQPGDGASLFPKIGSYDKFAIEWGYKAFPGTEPDEIKAELNSLLDRQKTDSTLRFGQQQWYIVDPYAQTEDLGDDAIKSTRYGIENLKIIARKLISATTASGDDLKLLREMYQNLLSQWYREMSHVANYVGGIEKEEISADDESLAYRMIPEEKQLEAIEFIGEYGFGNLDYLLDEDVIRKLESKGSEGRIMTFQVRLMNTLLNSDKLLRISEYESLGSGDHSLEKVMEAVRSEIWNDLDRSRIDIKAYKRNLQRQHVEFLASRLKIRDDLRPFSRAQLVSLERRCRSAANRASNSVTRAHLRDQAEIIGQYLRP